MEKLEAGKFEDKLIQSVQRARNFILVLSSSALDKCMGDTAMKDWVHKVRRVSLHFRFKVRMDPNVRPSHRSCSLNVLDL